MTECDHREAYENCETHCVGCEYESAISSLKSDLARCREALEKLHFTDNKIVELMNKAPATTVMSVLLIVGEIARKALRREE